MRVERANASRDAKHRDLKEVLEVAEAMARLRAPFWFSGGWAIDLFLGRVTREHHDVDVLVLRRDHLLLHDALKDFSLKKIIPHPDGMPPNRGTIVEWPKGERLELPVHQVNAYRAGESEPAFQVMLGESSDGDWIFRRNPDVRMPLRRIGFYPLWGLPYLAPEIVLLFKAKHLEERDQIDFMNALPMLNPNARRWLRDALERTHPGHAWLNSL
jgi:Aminoglycoside-2''-adenylyltransferase